MIGEFAPHASVIDVGGGSSRLAQFLLEAGHDRLAALDVSPAALDRARERMGDRAGRVRWIVGDVTRVEDVGTYHVWHDRAVFHFLTEPRDRARYADLLRRTLRPGGHAVIATFAPDGPAMCSGLAVVRYDGQSLARELGAGLTLLKSVPETHRTPRVQEQAFQYSVFPRQLERPSSPDCGSSGTLFRSISHEDSCRPGGRKCKFSMPNRRILAWTLLDLCSDSPNERRV